MLLQPTNPNPAVNVPPPRLIVLLPVFRRNWAVVRNLKFIKILTISNISLFMASYTTGYTQFSTIQNKYMKPHHNIRWKQSSIHSPLHCLIKVHTKQATIQVPPPCLILLLYNTWIKLINSREIEVFLNFTVPKVSLFMYYVDGCYKVLSTIKKNPRELLEYQPKVIYNESNELHKYHQKHNIKISLLID